MYKVAYVSGNSQDIGRVLRQSINDINRANGEIVEVVQSQSTHSTGFVIVTVTIIYKTKGMF